MGPIFPSRDSGEEYLAFWTAYMAPMYPADMGAPRDLQPPPKRNLSLDRHHGFGVRPSVDGFHTFLVQVQVQGPSQYSKATLLTC